MNHSGKRLIRPILIAVGTVSVALGVIGIIVPVLPTTPFLLLAAACYARSSERFYNRLLGNRLFGKYIRNYRAGRGIPVKVKALSLTFLWAAILFSVAFVIQDILIKAILIAIAVLVTAHIGSLKTPNE